MATHLHTAAWARCPPLAAWHLLCHHPNSPLAIGVPVLKLSLTEGGVWNSSGGGNISVGGRGMTRGLTWELSCSEDSLKVVVIDHISQNYNTQEAKVIKLPAPYSAILILHLYG